MTDETLRTDAARERAILREAARWLAREDVGTVDQEEFDAWLADSRHALAYARVLDAIRWATLAAQELHGQDPSAIERLVESVSKPVSRDRDEV
ncbi:protein of unknown function [Caulobacter sp. UNC279MFTsu5.1]|nr:protein of unknown function [Caulobacter sp. UNC279MFTsu5.1]